MTTPRRRRVAPKLREVDQSAYYKATLEALRAKEWARDELRRERADADFTAPPAGGSLADLLAKPRSPLAYTIDGLHPRGSNTVIAAQYKTGKTTLMLNLAKAWADEDKFLGNWAVEPTDGTLAYFNYELTEEQFLAYVQHMDIENAELVMPLNLRGYGLNLLSPAAFKWAVRWLREREVTALIVDPYGAAARLKNENDNSEARLWLLRLDELKREAGVVDLWMPAHTGRGEREEGDEHVRGASAVDDWADVRWQYTRMDGYRYLAAGGRGVEVPEAKVGHDGETGLLAVEEFHGRAVARREGALRSLVEAVEASPGINTRDLREAMRGDTAAKNAAIREAVEQGLIRVEKGPKNASLHYSTA